jgi:TonB-dependent SusC/RagA subfamily outer membrane receptor
MQRSLVRLAVLPLLLSGCALDRVTAPAPLPQRAADATLSAASQPASGAPAAAAPSTPRQGYTICLDCGGWGAPPDAQPALFVVDGRLYRPQPGRPVLSGLDPADIARVEILKGAAATALYGQDGANGVVIIQTRKPPVPVRPASRSH